MAPDRLVVGRVIRPHGIRGELIVEVVSDAPERFAPGSAMAVGDGLRPLTVAETRRHPKGGTIVRFAEIADRDDADGLRGLALTIAASEAMPPPEGAYYPHQIEGLEAVDEEGRPLGRITEVTFAPANDLWTLDMDGRAVLLPAIADVIRDVDLTAGRVVVRLLPGLVD